MSEKKGLPLELSRAAEGIVKRLDHVSVAMVLLAKSKKEYVMEFIDKGTINEDCPSAHQIVSAVYNGYEYVYGSADNRQSYVVEANPKLVEDIAEQVPEEERNLPAKPVKVSEKVAEAVKVQMRETIKSLKLAGLTLDKVMSITAITSQLTEEEIEQIFNS